jgi:hypothetical protein
MSVLIGSSVIVSPCSKLEKIKFHFSLQSATFITTHVTVHEADPIGHNVNI